MAALTRIQRRRTPGWRLSEGAIYVGRPSPWGNPWPWNAEWSTWLALALGQPADEPGRRAAAVIAYRWWLLNDGSPFPIPTETSGAGGEIEYSDGQVRKITDLVAGMGVMMLGQGNIAIPAKRPDLEPLRGHALCCWCPLDAPCHADVIAELLASP